MPTLRNPGVRVVTTAPHSKGRGCSKKPSHLLTRTSVSDVFVLDFDGVLIDSEPEVSQSAYAAAEQHWPDIFGNISDTKRKALLQNMRSVRPVLVRGYESMVMLRLLTECRDGTTAQSILNQWPELLPATLSRWKEDSDALHKVFEKTRGQWMTGEQSDAWLALNRPYLGVKEWLAECPFPFYIASSKAGHRLSTLLTQNFGLDVPADSPRLFSSLLPPEEKKVEALMTISGRPVCQSPGVRLHFVDDRLDTLLAVAQQQDLAGWNLYLADWGYVTAAELAEAKRLSRIKVLQLKQLQELLKWGMVMGVDDGCEPTAEEVAAQFE